MKKIILLTLLVTSYFPITAQKSYIFKSKDEKVSAENFIAFDEGRDSLVIKNKNHKFKFSYDEPFIRIKDSEGYNLFDNGILVRNIKKIKKQIYLIVGYAGNLNVETELHLFFIKKDKILKYYVIKSYNKRLRDIDFNYISNKEGGIASFSKIYTPQDYIYDIDLNTQTLDTIKPLTGKTSDSLSYNYKLKIK